MLRARRLAIAYERDEPCGLCGRPIGWEFAWPHPGSPVCDHVHPVALGGAGLPALEDLQPVHARCSARQGQRLRGVAR